MHKKEFKNSTGMDMVSVITHFHISGDEYYPIPVHKGHEHPFCINVRCIDGIHFKFTEDMLEFL